MSTTATTAHIVCQGCQRKFSWKPELAGRRVRCKCGQAISVPDAAAAGGTAASPPPRVRPAAPPVAPSVAPSAAPSAAPTMHKRLAPQVSDDFDALAALAADAEQKAADLPIEVREDVAVADPAPAPKRRAAAAAAIATVPGRAPRPGGVPLAYRQGPAGKEAQRAAAHKAALLDPVRDVYAPAAVLVVGLIAYTAYVCTTYHVSTGSMPLVLGGLSLMLLIKTVLLVGGALILSGPLGVGFGDVRTAVLKLAAIAVFTDASAEWIDHGMAAITNGFGGGMVTVALTTAMYWVLMCYLFSLDASDAWNVIICLGLLGFVVRFVIGMLLLATVLNMGGMGSAASSAASAAPTVKASELSTEVDEMKQNDGLVEARKYIADGHDAAAKDTVDAWYAAGCRNVWFEMGGRDINGRRGAGGMIVQLPTAPAARAKVYDLWKKYVKDCHGYDLDPEDLKDTGETYLKTGL